MDRGNGMQLEQFKMGNDREYAEALEKQWQQRDREQST
jgi:hypothetical protein